MRDSRAVNGILLLDKPRGISSNRALQQARRVFGAAKAGHTGSLDPLATGLLPVCFGEATKIAGLLLGGRKAYTAACRLGIVTDTCDSDGAVVARFPVPALGDDAIGAALARFIGRIVQVPPVYSALKQGGVPLYRRARRGEHVVAPPREVDVFRFELAGRDGDVLRLDVECGSGTYVRSLVRDLGEALGCGAHLVALRRLWVEPFLESRMYTLDELEVLRGASGVGSLEQVLLPVSAGLAGWPVLRLDAPDAESVAHGRPVRVAAAPGRARAEGPDGRLLAIGEVGADANFRVARGFAWAHGKGDGEKGDRKGDGGN